MATIDAFGLSAQAPSGWDGEIYRREPEAPGPRAGVLDTQASAITETSTPILQLANFPLPAVRGDYGGGAVELMGSGGIFISLLEHTAGEGSATLFRDKSIPWPLAPDDFHPETMQRTIAGQAGFQSFFTQGDRPFCLYVVIGSYRLRSVLVRAANEALATIRFD